MDITFWGIVSYVVAGLVIGALARLILPGKQAMTWGATLVLGVVAAIIGGILWNAVFSGNEGVAWIGSIIVAVVLLFLYERMVAKKAG
ncbi:MAG TPA: GlsB/YeaQ/YmgE family stress response membrane protein [Actinomycetota bacterium]